jgi:hypothetical protein
MADISKCFGEDCPKKKDCLRYTAPSSTYQFYISELICMNNDFDLFLGNKKFMEKKNE